MEQHRHISKLTQKNKPHSKASKASGKIEDRSALR